jgi:predicted membrane-bound spermidine synthase
VLELAAFIAGASIMGIEIVASRILAPFLGNSIVVWSSLIGVILAALSYGYWKGGRLADRNPSVATLSGLFAAATVLIFLIAITKNLVLTLVSHITDVRVASVVAEIVLFAPVSIVLAMVSPYVVRLKMKEVGSAGETIGRLYAISTIGSIFGTFAAGFYLLAIVGSTAILFCIAGLLFAASLLLSKTAYVRYKATTLACAALTVYLTPTTSAPFVPNPHVYETDSHYNHYLVYDTPAAPGRRPMRNLMMDRSARLNSIFLDRNDDFALEYLRYFKLGAHFRPDARTALLLGGGAFIFPGDFLQRFPDKHMDVVELDPALESIAGNYFGFKRDPRLGLFYEDARTYLNRCSRTYDVVYVDVFGSNATVPYYMTTEEATRRIYQVLSRDGIAVLNMIAAIDGPRGRFFRAELATWRSVFPRVEVFRADGNPRDVANIILVALKRPGDINWSTDDPNIGSYLAHRWTLPVRQDTPVLTDDYAPVEIYMAGWFGARK